MKYPTDRLVLTIGRNVRATLEIFGDVTPMMISRLIAHLELFKDASYGSEAEYHELDQRLDAALTDQLDQNADSDDG